MNGSALSATGQSSRTNHVQSYGAAVKAKPCKQCQSEWHTAFNCPYKPRRPLQTVKRLKTTGKHYYKWQVARRTWFKEHDSEFFVCYLCGRWLTKEDTTLDHVKSRGRHPELRYDQSNLKPCCWDCNEKKGSRDG